MQYPPLSKSQMCAADTFSWQSNVTERFRLAEEGFIYCFIALSDGICAERNEVFGLISQK